MTGNRDERTKEEDEVLETERRRYQAMVEGDLPALEGLLADSLTYTHATGQQDTKGEFLQNLRAGSLRYESIQPSEARVRFFGSAAVVTGTSQMGVRVGDRQLQFWIRYLALYELGQHGWQLVAWQSTRLPDDGES